MDSISQNTLGSCLNFKKAMLKCELLPFCDLKVVNEMLYLSKASLALVRDYYLSDFVAHLKLTHLERYKITVTDLTEFFNQVNGLETAQDIQVFSSLINGKLIKTKEEF